MQLLTCQKKILGPVHLHPKTDIWDYLQSPIMKKKMFLVFTSGKFLEALGSGIGTGSIFCLSCSLSNNTNLFNCSGWCFWTKSVFLIFFTLEQSLWSKEQIVEGGTTGKMPITLFDQKINVRQKLNLCLDNFSEIIFEGASKFLTQLKLFQNKKGQKNFQPHSFRCLFLSCQL